MPRLVGQITPPPTINFNTVGATEDAQGNLWFATNEGVVRFDGRQFRVYHDPVLRQGDDYFHVIPSPDGRIWCKLGRGSALSYVDPRLDRLVRVPDSTRLVREYLSRWRSNYLFADADANLWIGLRTRGLIRVNTHTYAVEKVFDKAGEAVRWITQDGQGTIWFTTNQGVYAHNQASHTLKQYRHEPDQPTRSLTSNFALGIHARRDGTILVGLNNEVNVIHPATGQVSRLELISSKRKPIQEVYDFHDDAQGNTYFRTLTASYRYTRRGELQQLEFSSITHPVKYLFPSRNNRLWVTAGQTLRAYDLSRIRPVPAFNLLDVVINGNRLDESTDKQRLVRDATGHPTLTVQEGDLISVRVSPYITNFTRTFRLRLEGYDRQWNVVEEVDHMVSYQLSAGTYALTLNRFVNSSGWEKNVSTLTIVVEPPVWKTPWFLFVSFMIVAGSGFGIFRNWNRRRKLRQELARQAFEAAALREMDEMKSRFFANITHEFRTPLTIILNATEQLASASLNPPEQKRVESVQRNAHQLLRLVHETLDMAKLDAGKLDRREHLGDPVGFVEQVVAQFWGLADQKLVGLEWIGDSQAGAPGLYRFDDDKVEKITYNLLANALKFTPAGGHVRVEARMTADHRFALRVADTGIGIAPDELPRIFERFHQVDSSSTRAYSGTGIGLALVKELTDWMGGTVAVESTVGKGSLFTVELPLTPYTITNSPNTDAAIHSPSPNDEQIGAGGSDSVPVRQPGTTSLEKDDRALVLIVEDNEELRTYIGEFLSTDYRIVTAENGRLGLDQAIAEVPDLIVSDVMMPDLAGPELDGYELVERLKADERTSHIPVVLLTAKSSYDSRMKGLGAGADDYMGKPFSLAELGLRIGNCLTTRQNWQRWLMTQSATTDAPLLPDPQLTKEHAFLTRLRQLVLDHLVDEAVDVDWLATQANMSRTQLHRKLTALTNLSTTRFIHSVRLQKAVDLLQTGEFNVAQVAQAVGYNSQSYFTKVFQEHFGYAPHALKV